VLNNLLSEIKNCQICASYLNHGVNPIVSAHQESKIAIIGQAPGSVVHKTGIPWDDKSGQRLREWLNVSDNDFYNEKLFALIPMGFCFPGKGKSGDLPPRPECAPKWHNPLLNQLKNIQLVLLIGNYAQQYYLGKQARNTLTETVHNFKDYLPKYLPLPHPSPRNNIWLKKNPWFKKELLPELQNLISNLSN